MTTRYREKLSDAQSEVRAWQAGRTHPYPPETFDRIVRALERATRAASPEELRREVDVVTRLATDEGPMTGELMPSFYEVADAVRRPRP